VLPNAVGGDRRHPQWLVGECPTSTSGRVSCGSSARRFLPLPTTKRRPTARQMVSIGRMPEIDPVRCAVQLSDTTVDRAGKIQVGPEDGRRDANSQVPKRPSRRRRPRYNGHDVDPDAASPCAHRSLSGGIVRRIDHPTHSGLDQRLGARHGRRYAGKGRASTIVRHPGRGGPAAANANTSAWGLDPDGWVRALTDHLDGRMIQHRTDSRVGLVRPRNAMANTMRARHRGPFVSLTPTLSPTCARPWPAARPTALAGSAAEIHGRARDEHVGPGFGCGGGAIVWRRCPRRPRTNNSP